MSVSNPVGSGGGFVSFDQDLQGMAEQMNTVGGWAEIMAQDSLNNTVEEEESRDESNERTFQVQERDFPDSRVPLEGPFQVQLTNVPSACDADELFFFLGGEDKIMDIDVKADKGRATITFSDRETVLTLLEESKALKLKFMENNLKVFVLQPNRPPWEPKVARERDSYPQHGSQQYTSREPYSRQSSRYNSQSSISSDARYDNRRYDRPEYGRKDHYGTMPPPRGSHRDDYRGGFRGGYRVQRGGGRGGYTQRSSGSYEMQRSESYTHDRDRPAPISSSSKNDWNYADRSRTESTQIDRRQSDMQSRTSSQFSLNNDEPRPQIKKPTAKDIFGDAKPVDTADKLREIEKRMEEQQKQKLEQEKAEKEAAKQQQQQQQQAIMAQSHPPPHPHHGQPQYGQFHPRHHHGTHYYGVPGMPPPYYQSMPPPVFTTPVVQMHPHTHQQPMYQGQEQQMSPRFDGTPGSVKILQRTDPDREGGANSPPLDPEHTPEPVKEPVAPKDSISNQSMSKESIKSDSSHKAPGKYKGKVMTFTHSSHKGFDGGRGSYRGGGRGGRGGRGGGHGGHRNDTVAAAASSENNNNNVTKENAPQDEPRLNKENESQDHHGSQSSLKHRGHGKPMRGGRGGGNRGFNKAPRSREDRGSRDEQPKTDGGHHPHHQKDQKSTGKKDDEKAPVSKTPSKSEVKDVPAKEPQTPKAQEAEAPSTPTSEANQKKNKKKKLQNTTKAAVSVMNGNKFAALLNADE